MEQTREAAATCPFNHHDSSVRGDAFYSIYDEIRAGGVSWSTHYGGFWLVADYANARVVLKDHRMYSSADGCFLPDAGDRALGLEQDPPEHTPFRKLFTAGVGRPAVARHEGALKEMIDRVVTRFAASGGGDAREEVSEQVPVEAVALMFGLSADVSSRLRELTTNAWRLKASDPDAFGRVGSLLLSEAQARREDPKEDFLTTLVHAEVDGERLDDGQLANFLIGAVVAGHETTMNASTNLLHELSRDVELQERLRRDPSLIPRVIEESLRHRAPIHLFFRTATADGTLGDVAISAGDKVAVLYAGANRDGAKFPDPDAFDPDRADVSHMSFGWGVHRCVGSFLAQTELRLLVEALLSAGTWVPDGPVEHAPLEGGHHMGFKHLPLKLQA